ncbi:hypothetical protein [Campylobacter rectus]|nr:hypothetical protein [Campylobacter rectus]UEB47580.1 hypothetical protein LK437_11390 [Campylobacter rectus]
MKITYARQMLTITPILTRTARPARMLTITADARQANITAINLTPKTPP